MASFYPKAPFYKKWKDVAIAISITAIIFIVWDEIFTRLGYWGFNPKYITGLNIGSLPIEEILFFVCIPYSCVFTYFALRYFIQNDYFFSHNELLSNAIIVASLIGGIYYMDKPYTALTLFGLAFYLAFLTLKLRVRYLGHFYAAFGIILIPFFIVNGILTGSIIEGEVVWYNEVANVGFRVGTIPIEDVFYAMLLLLMNVSIYEWLQDHYKK
jgi:lycopene cyclase domain-containing protein